MTVTVLRPAPSKRQSAAVAVGLLSRIAAELNHPELLAAATEVAWLFQEYETERQRLVRHERLFDNFSP